MHSMGIVYYPHHVPRSIIGIIKIKLKITRPIYSGFQIQQIVEYLNLNSKCIHFIAFVSLLSRLNQDMKEKMLMYALEQAHNSSACGLLEVNNQYSSSGNRGFARIILPCAQHNHTGSCCNLFAPQNLHGLIHFNVCVEDNFMLCTL